MALLRKEKLISVCPEQLGGLPTPREPVKKRKERVFTKSGKDVTKELKQGAKEILKITNFYNIKEAILKQRSLSYCCGEIYDGAFLGKVIKADGITSSFLEKMGLK